MKFSNLIKKNFCLDFLGKRFEDLPRINKLPPKRESLLLYRDCIKMCRKFYWKNTDGREWSEILLKTARKEFEEYRNLLDSVEVGRKVVLGRQALIQIEEKINKVQMDMYSFIDKTKTQT